MNIKDIENLISQLKKIDINQLEDKMNTAAKQLNFEEAAKLRDQVKKLRQKMSGKI